MPNDYVVVPTETPWYGVWQDPVRGYRFTYEESLNYCSCLLYTSFARRFASGALRFLLCRAHKKAAAAQPELDRLLAEQTVCQQTLEQAGCANPDEAAEPTGRMTAAILEKCAVRPEDAHILGLSLIHICCRDEANLMAA